VSSKFFIYVITLEHRMGFPLKSSKNIVGRGRQSEADLSLKKHVLHCIYYACDDE